MQIVISLGGSLIVPDKFDLAFLMKFKKVIEKFKTRHRFFIVCGGGKVARAYAQAAQKLRLSETAAHLLGIEATLVNAKLLALLLRARFIKGSVKRIASEEARVMITGGIREGWTTDVVAALIAKEVRADCLINLTDVPGVYDKDPHKHKKAKLFSKLSWEEFLELAKKVKIKPGMHFVFDPRAAIICKAARIKVIIMKGVENLDRFLGGEKFEGTRIE
jgi:uridylate kinase